VEQFRAKRKQVTPWSKFEF